MEPEVQLSSARSMTSSNVGDPSKEVLVCDITSSVEVEVKLASNIGHQVVSWCQKVMAAGSGISEPHLFWIRVSLVVVVVLQ